MNKLMINNKTKIFISIGTNPGRTGTFIYNNLFRKKKINAIYKSFKIEKLNDLVKSIKTLKIDGFSVAMPYKSKIIPMLDQTEKIAKSINSVNTVLQQRGKLIGYNTDVSGIDAALKKYKIPNESKVLIIGLGGAASCTLFALTKLHKIKNIYVTNRSKKNINILKKIGKFTFLKKIKNQNIYFDVIINATSLGLKDGNDFEFNFDNVKDNLIYIDTIYNPMETKTLKFLKENKIKTFNGLDMFIYQGQKSFYLWNKINPEIDDQLIDLLISKLK